MDETSRYLRSSATKLLAHVLARSMRESTSSPTATTAWHDALEDVQNSLTGSGPTRVLYEGPPHPLPNRHERRRNAALARRKK